MRKELKARRVGGRTSTLIPILIGLIVFLLIVVVVFIMRSSIFGDPTATEIARDEVIAALSQNPGDPGLLMTLAEIDYDLGRKRDALDYAEQAADAAGETLTIHLRYAMLLMREGDLNAAREQLDAEIELDPSNSDAYFLLGQIQREQGDFDDALGTLEQALALAPVDGDVRLVYALTLREAGREDEAIEAYKSVLMLLPDNEYAIEALAELGVTYEATGTATPHDN